MWERIKLAFLIIIKPEVEVIVVARDEKGRFVHLERYCNDA